MIRKTKLIIFLIVLFLIGTGCFAACGAKEFTVTFNGNGGTLISGEERQIIKEGGSVTPPVYEREGYTLSWDISLDEINSDITVNAVWTLVKYTYIFYDDDGETVLKSQTADYGSAIIPPQDPVKAATAEYTYTFIGWDKDIPQTLKENITFTAEYSFAVNPYTITFESNGGSSVNAITQDYGTAVTAPQAPEKTGYDFGGWYTDNGTFENAYTFSAMPAQSVTLYAKWIAVGIEDLFERNKNSFNEIWEGIISCDDISYMTGEEMSQFTQDDEFLHFVKIMFTEEMILAAEFKDISAQQAISVIMNFFGVSLMQYHDTQIIINNWYSLSYILGGEINCSDSVYYSYDGETLIRYKGNDISYTVPSGVKHIGSFAFADNEIIENITLPEGLQSIGDSAFFGCISLKEIAVPGSVTEAGEKAFGYCESLTTVRIGNGLTYISRRMFYNNYELTDIIIPDNITQIGENAFYGCESLEGIVIPESVIIIGEYAFANCDLLTVYAEAAQKPAGWDNYWNFDNCPVYWNWAIIYTVTFDGGGGELVSGELVQKVNHGYYANAPEFKREGYFFEGWSADFDVITSDLTVTALWSSDCTYTFYDYDGTVLKTDTVTYGSLITEPSPERVSPYKIYTFTGWDKQVPQTITEKNLEFTAQYTEADRYYTYIFYDWDLETVLKTQRILYDESLIYPDDPEKPSTQQYHYDFWYWNFVKTDNPDEWNVLPQFGAELRQYTYTFLDYDGSVIHSVTGYYGQTVTRPFDPYRKGDAQYSYRFTGWDKEIPVITQDMTFTACYEQTVNQYTVIFETNGGSEIASVTQDYGTKVERPADPEKEGMEFGGWYKELTFLNLYDFEESVLTEDIILYAKWNQMFFELIDGGEAYKLTSIGTVKSLNVIIPSTYNGKPVVSIGENAFWQSNVNSIVIPDSVKIIEESAFSGCGSLTSVTMPSGLEVIGQYAFAMSGVQAITIPGSVNTIGDNAFWKCGSLQSVTVCDGVSVIGSEAFSQTAIETLILPDSVKSINSMAFMSASRLTSVVLGTGLETIGYGAFKDCAELLSAEVKSGLQSIDVQAFSGCFKLAGITIPDTVNEIGEYAFKDTAITDITVPGSVKTIRNSTFENCVFLTNVTLEYGIETITDSAFANTAVSSLIIPDSVLSIGYHAFYLCSNLKTLILGISVQNIAGSAFPVMIEKITSKNPVPPNLGKYAFSGGPLIYVPAASVNAYKTAGNWEDFASVIVAMPVIIFDSNGGSEVQSIEAAYGAPVSEPQPPTKDGYAFGGWYTEDNEPYDFSLPVTASITLYAIWIDD